MTHAITPLEQTFLDLAAIDEVHPHEDQVLKYIKRRLHGAGVEVKQDKTGNIVARLAGGTGGAVAFVGHVDIAAPLKGRQIIVEDDVIKTDGKGLLGGDDKTAVAAMLELADAVRAGEVTPAQPVELVFTVGEEPGCMGAKALDMSLVTAKQALVFDWLGAVTNVVTRSPAYYKIDVEFTGKAAHPAHWQDGKNAGAALIAAAAQIQQGEYAPDVTCNIGIFGFGEARNQVPGRATLQAELRSYDTAKIEAAAAQVKAVFEQAAADHGLTAGLTFVKDSPAYELNRSGALFSAVAAAHTRLGIKTKLESTFGCFDGNILAGRGLEVVMLGAAYHNPHNVDEYVDRDELAGVLAFAKQLTLVDLSI